MTPWLLLAVLAAHGPAPCAAQEEEARQAGMELVARVGDEVITSHELDRYCLLTAPEYHDLRYETASVRREEVRFQRLEKLIMEEIVLQAADAQGLTLSENDEELVQLEIERAAEPYRGLDGLREALARLEIPMEYFVELQRRNLLIRKLVVQSISREIFVTPTQVRRYYDEHRDMWATDPAVRLRLITVYPDARDCAREPLPPLVLQRVAGGGAWNARAHAEELRRRVLAGEDFAEVAALGCMGYLWDRELVGRSVEALALNPPLLAEAANGLEVGEVSPIVESEQGALYLLYLVDRQPAGHRALEEVQNEVEAKIRDAVWAERVTSWERQLREQAQVQSWLPAPQK